VHFRTWYERKDSVEAQTVQCSRAKKERNAGEDRVPALKRYVLIHKKRRKHGNLINYLSEMPGHNNAGFATRWVSGTIAGVFPVFDVFTEGLFFLIRHRVELLR
jgi:hypothetical protein